MLGYITRFCHLKILVFKCQKWERILLHSSSVLNNTHFPFKLRRVWAKMNEQKGHSNWQRNNDYLSTPNSAIKTMEEVPKIINLNKSHSGGSMLPSAYCCSGGTYRVQWTRRSHRRTYSGQQTRKLKINRLYTAFPLAHIYKPSPYCQRNGKTRAKREHEFQFEDCAVLYIGIYNEKDLFRKTEAGFWLCFVKHDGKQLGNEISQC